MVNRGRILSVSCLLAMGLALLSGCSSLPRSPERVTALDTRAASAYQAGLRRYRAGDFLQAAACFENALAIHASVDDRPGTARALASLGRARLALGELDEATATFQRALDAARGLGRPELAAEALGGLGAAALERGRPDDARTWIEAGLALPLADPGSRRAVLLHDLGAACRMAGDAATAEIHLRRALAMHEALGDRLGAAADGHTLAILRAEAGDLDEATDLARRALERDKDLENPRGVAQDLMLLGSLAERSGDTVGANDYYRRAELAWTALGQPEEAASAAARMGRP